MGARWFGAAAPSRCPRTSPVPWRTRTGTDGGSARPGRGGCELVAVRAWHGPVLESAPYPLADSDQLGTYRQQGDDYVDVLSDVGEDLTEVTVRRKAVRGTAHQTLLETAGPADLLVVGARRRHGAIGLQLGGVNHAMLHYAPCPVAIVPERE
ncbi:universal stress protein [Streptomyces niveus]|uniref:universal stress protein n=1 Tax=Streptomyces niveus TaxID=193462 RepID=UPI0036D127A7